MQCSKSISKDVRAVRSDWTTQEPRRALRITRVLFEIPLLCLRRARLERKSMQNRTKIDENPSLIHPKSTKNRYWDVLGAQSRFGDASGRARDGLWTPKCRPKADLGAPRASQERPRAVQKRPRAGPKTLQTLPVSRPSASAAPSGFERAFKSIFGRFCLVARKLRCASRISFYSVLLGSHEISTARARAPTNLENRVVLPSKIEPGSVRGTQHRARAAKVERRNASEGPPGPPKIF